MARTTKKGLEYFPMDIDIFSNIKIRKLIKYQGGKAVSVYTLLLCNIYKSGYYMKWDNELPFICSELTGFEEAYISEVVKTCLNLGLFSKELFDAEKVLTSKSIQERYERICMQCRRVGKIDDYCLLTSQEPKHSNKEAKKKKEVEKQIIPQYEPYTLTLDEEIETLKADEVWLDGLQLLHSTPKEQLLNSLPDFRIQCIADGKENGHTSMADAKQHFNNWYRKFNHNRKRNGNKTNIGFNVSATSAEDYSDWLQD